MVWKYSHVYVTFDRIIQIFITKIGLVENEFISLSVVMASSKVTRQTKYANQLRELGVDYRGTSRHNSHTFIHALRLIDAIQPESLFLSLCPHLSSSSPILLHDTTVSLTPLTLGPLSLAKSTLNRFLRHDARILGITEIGNGNNRNLLVLFSSSKFDSLRLVSLLRLCLSLWYGHNILLSRIVSLLVSWRRRRN